MSEQRALFLRKGFIGTCALVGARAARELLLDRQRRVERAAQAACSPPRHGSAPAPSLGAACRASRSARNALFARVGN